MCDYYKWSVRAILKWKRVEFPMTNFNKNEY